MNDKDVEGLIKTTARLINATDLSYRRNLNSDIEYGTRLTILKGFRGTGKTTLLLQHLKDKLSIKDTIFLSLDNIFFAEHKFLETIDFFYEKGYRTFILDEVHRYTGWSIELKNVYDSYPDVKVLATSSSALDIMKGESDLSRRADVYILRGLSFHEYLMYEYDINVPTFDFDNLLKSKDLLAEDYYEKHDIKRKFNSYLKKGYYPYFKESGKNYYPKMMSALNQVIDIDLPAIFNIDYESTRQIKKLLSVISRIAPFSPNIAKLSRTLNIPRSSILLFIDYLESADVISVIKSGKKSDSAMTKPDKILLENTNLLYALSGSTNKGTIRETFVINALKGNHAIATPAKGDVMLDRKYTIEIGGKSKNVSQIYDMPNPILIKDDIVNGGEGILPMWMLGFLK
ncbi:MAG: AAA family ATPase [Saprospiraceae bacterium]